jgi:hypothetical protein
MYTDLAVTFGTIAEENQVIDSLRDGELDDSEPLAPEDGDLTNLEIRRGSELEQAVRSMTGMPQRKLHPHPDG